MLKREGEKARKDKVGPFITRDDKILEPGDVLFADGHVVNFEVLHPETGKPHRPTLIVWFDWRSRMPVGWEIMPTENTVAVASALRMGIITLGAMPRVCYVDNGKAFKAKFFTRAGADLEELDGLYARLGIAVQYSRPYEARTKIVERFFRTFDEQCARLLPSYSGNTIANKPAWRARNERYHKAVHNEYVPSIQEAAEIFRLYVGWYARQSHRSLEATPGEILEAGRGPGVDLSEINRHFLWTRQVTPRRCGFTIAGVRFESDALYGLNKQILAKYNWADLSKVYLYDSDGTQIGEARPTEGIHPLARHFGGELDMEKVRAANRRQRELERQTMDLARELDGVDEAGLSELPWMRRRKQPLRVLPSQPTAKPELSPERRAELEEVARIARREREGRAVSYTLPTFFSSRMERYEFLFDLEVKQGVPLEDADAAFCREFERSEDYRRLAGDSFDKLREIYARRRKEAM